MPFVWIIGGSPEPYRPLPARSPRIRPIAETDGSSPVRPVESGSTPEQKAYEKAGPDPKTRRRKPALLVKQIMTTPVETISPDTPVAEAQTLFGDRRFHHVPVVTKQGSLVGVLSDRNLLRATEKKVSDIMTKEVLTATPETPIREAAKMMVNANISCLPILDPAHRIVGIVSRTDILRIVVNQAPLDLWT